MVIIYLKKSFYGEYTFHYWLWKNKIKSLENDWIGFANIESFGHQETIHK